MFGENIFIETLIAIRKKQHKNVNSILVRLLYLKYNIENIAKENIRYTCICHIKPKSKIIILVVFHERNINKNKPIKKRFFLPNCLEGKLKLDNFVTDLAIYNETFVFYKKPKW